MTGTPELTQDTIDEFVKASHGNLAKLKEMADRYTALLHSRASWNETPLGAASHVGNREIIEFLLARGVALDIFAASVLGWKERVAEFLEKDPDLARAGGAHGIPVLVYPALGGHTAIGELLVAKGADVNAGAGGVSPLHGAAMAGQAGFAAWLLAQGADVNAKNYEGKTPLAMAQQAGHAEVAQLLRRHGGKV